MSDQTYTYQRSSVARRTADRVDLRLATSGGTVTGETVDHPFFFDGFIENAEQAAQGLLLVARVARTRFFTPMNMTLAKIRAADPVVSCDGTDLRFESFSPCCGVYARLDLRAGTLDASVARPGTTNVDLNPDMRGVLAAVGPHEPLHLNVGESLSATTIDATATEERVPLPDRWVKGFAEAQVIAADLEEKLVVTPTAARAFVRGLPAASQPSGLPFGVAPTPTGLRLTSSALPAPVSLGGPERLRILEPMLRFATTMRVSGPGPGAAGASLWQLDLADAHLSLVLSPTASRGFSGEGRALESLVDPDAGEDADRVLQVIATDGGADQIAYTLGLPVARVRTALAWLGAAGMVGYDAAVGRYFERELPLRQVEKLNPRLIGARRLLEKGAVILTADGGEVRSTEATYVVRDGPTATCTCAWFGQYRQERGPCKHLLAVRLARKDGS